MIIPKISFLTVKTYSNQFDIPSLNQHSLDLMVWDVNDLLPLLFWHASSIVIHTVKYQRNYMPLVSFHDWMMKVLLCQKTHQTHSKPVMVWAKILAKKQSRWKLPVISAYFSPFFCLCQVCKNIFSICCVSVLFVKAKNVFYMLWLLLAGERRTVKSKTSVRQERVKKKKEKTKTYQMFFFPPFVLFQ